MLETSWENIKKFKGMGTLIEKMRQIFHFDVVKWQGWWCGYQIWLNVPNIQHAPQTVFLLFLHASERWKLQAKVVHVLCLDDRRVSGHVLLLNTENHRNVIIVLFTLGIWGWRSHAKCRRRGASIRIVGPSRVGRLLPSASRVRLFRRRVWRNGDAPLYWIRG